MLRHTGDALDAMSRLIGPSLAVGLLLAAAAAAQPVTSGASMPSGKLWHHDKNPVGQEGSAIGDIGTGAYRALGRYRFPVPTRDGSRYLEERYDSSQDTTEIWIRRSIDGSVIDHMVVDGAITDVELSPVNANLIRMNWGENALSYATYAVYDLAARRVIWADDDRSRTQYTAWLPDGRLLGISSAGLLTRCETSGTGRVTVMAPMLLRPTAFRRCAQAVLAGAVRRHHARRGRTAARSQRQRQGPGRSDGFSGTQAAMESHSSPHGR